jgi:type IV pilus assembly protein PilW
MTQTESATIDRQRGMSLIEVMISIVIGMLLVLVIYQVYEVSEGQKRAITAGSDAQQNASYGAYILGRELSVAGNGIASMAASLDTCALLRPIPVVIEAGATASDPDTITVLYGGSSSLSTPVQFKQTATTAQPYVVAGPVAFSANDVIAAVQGSNCTLSTVNAGGVAVDAVTGFATLTHTPVPGSPGATYNAVNAALVNLGPVAAMGRIAYTVDTTGHVLRAQNRLPADGPVVPLVNDVVNVKAQYGLDTDNDGAIDVWQPATSGVWLAANLATQPLATLKQIRAVRIAIVTRSPQCDLDATTHQCIDLTPGPLDLLDGTVTMNLSADEKKYRYKVLETIVPLRNAMWNSP